MNGSDCLEFDKKNYFFCSSTLYKKQSVSSTAATRCNKKWRVNIITKIVSVPDQRGSTSHIRLLKKHFLYTRASVWKIRRGGSLVMKRYWNNRFIINFNALERTNFFVRLSVKRDYEACWVGSLIHSRDAKSECSRALW